jgi:hypothetical protein
MNIINTTKHTIYYFIHIDFIIHVYVMFEC